MTVTKVEMVPVYPPFVMSCEDAPGLPSVITGQTVGEYVLRMDAAYTDCKSTLRDIGEWVASDKSQRKKDAGK